MRSILLFNFFFLFSSFIIAQTITIIDKETKEPLPFVSLYSATLKVSTESDMNGKVSISMFRKSTDIQVQLLGYERASYSYEELSKLDGKLSLIPSAFQLNPVVISATRWKQNKGDLSTKISSISKKEVRFQNPQTTADLLGTSGEVFIQKSQQGGGSPIIRGFSTNRLLYSVDGVRMNTAIFRSGNLQNVISLDPFAIENTEVLFGPGSVIYGSDAIGGVMNFTTSVPNLKDSTNSNISGNAAIRYASANNEQTSHLDLTIASGKWSCLSSITQSDYSDLRMGKNGPKEYERSFVVERRNSDDIIFLNKNSNLQIPSSYSQINLMQKVRFKASDFWEFNYGLHYSETSDFARYDRLLQLTNDTPRYGEWKYGPQKWIMNHFSALHSKSTNLFDEFAVNAAHQRFEESRINRLYQDSLLRNRVEKVDALSLNIDFQKKIKNQHTLFYGFEGVWNGVDSEGSTENILTNKNSEAASRYPNSDWYTAGIYISNQWEYHEKLVFNTGIRYTFYGLHSRFDTSLFSLPFNKASLSNSAINGSLGAVFRPTTSLVLSSNASTGFRAPNVDDIGKIFSDSEPGNIVVPNKDLKAEFAYNFDFGVAKTFGNFLNLDLTAYYTYIDDALVRRDFTLNGQDSIAYENTLSKVQAVQNAANAYVYGIQFGLELKVNQYFSLSSTLNYQKGEETLDDGTRSPSRHVVPTFGISRLTYEKKKWRIQLYAEYSGEFQHEELNIGEKEKPHIYAIDQNGNPYSPSWYTLNVKTQFMLSDKVFFSLGFENLTDQRYKTYSSGIAAAGRNLILGANARF